MDTFPTPGLLGFWPEGVLLNNLYATNFNLPRFWLILEKRINEKYNIFHLAPAGLSKRTSDMFCLYSTWFTHWTFFCSIKEALKKIACKVKRVGHIFYFTLFISMNNEHHRRTRIFFLAKQVGLEHKGWFNPGSTWYGDARRVSDHHNCVCYSPRRRHNQPQY